jgi:hypothetical protein
MKQGVLTTARVRLLLSKGESPSHEHLAPDQRTIPPPPTLSPIHEISGPLMMI